MDDLLERARALDAQPDPECVIPLMARLPEVPSALLKDTWLSVQPWSSPGGVYVMHREQAGNRPVEVRKGRFQLHGQDVVPLAQEVLFHGGAARVNMCRECGSGWAAAVHTAMGALAPLLRLREAVNVAHALEDADWSDPLVAAAGETAVRVLSGELSTHPVAVAQFHEFGLTPASELDLQLMDTEFAGEQVAPELAKPVAEFARWVHAEHARLIQNAQGVFEAWASRRAEYGAVQGWSMLAVDAEAVGYWSNAFQPTEHHKVAALGAPVAQVVCGGRCLALLALPAAFAHRVTWVLDPCPLPPLWATPTEVPPQVARLVLTMVAPYLSRLSRPQQAEPEMTLGAAVQAALAALELAQQSDLADPRSDENALGHPSEPTCGRVPA